MKRRTSRRRSCRPEKHGERGLHFACTWSFYSPESQLSVKLWPLFHVSKSLLAAEANEGWQEGFFFHSAVQGILILLPPFPPFSVNGETPVQLNGVKIDLFMLGSVLHLSMFCTALVFNGKSCLRSS
ncbi:hypothetical protein CHARACLAT_004815 [Characodon lateralis]|uniref:Uncharacterized protein n=1 Tax=Characodon lateralis TaxID=208331 RepID=A0ABU7ERI0_9TELE|nr:hypothetical protein [Characodon lateralis]